MKRYVSPVEEGFQKLQQHFITPSHRETYTTKWNSLKYSDFKAQQPSKITPELLYLLFYRAQDLQTLLDEDFQTPLLLRDCILRAVKLESFYQPLVTSIIPRDPHESHTCLHQVLSNKNDATNLPVNKSNVNQIYFTVKDSNIQN